MKNPSSAWLCRAAWILALGLLSGTVARATDYSWNGATALSYSSASSWLVNGVAPTSAPSAAAPSSVNIITPNAFGDMFLPGVEQVESFDVVLTSDWLIRTSGNNAGSLSVLGTFTKDGAAALSFHANGTTAPLSFATVNLQAVAGTLTLGSASSTLRMTSLAVTGTTTVSHGATVNVYGTTSGGPSFSTITTAGAFNVLNNSTATTVTTGAVTVSSGGVLAGTAAIQAGSGTGITVNSGGVVSAGSAGAGTLILDGANTTAALLTMQSGAQFSFTLGSGNTSTLLTFDNYASGDLVLNNTTLSLTGARAGTFKLFNFYSDSGATLTASGISSGLDLADSTGLSGFTASLQYNASDISLVLVATPEPSTVALLAGLGALFAAFRLARPRGTVQA